MVRALVDTYVKQNEKRSTVRETGKPSAASRGKGV
jgi:hypothetical protein